VMDSVGDGRGRSDVGEFAKALDACGVHALAFYFFP
jgi:hypothetical protein